MSVEEKPARWTARDGRAFPTKEEAEVHDRLVEARDAHADATRKLGVELARNAKTKDGHPFELRRWGDYFRIVHPYAQGPRVERVRAPWGSWSFEWDNAGDLEICEPRGSSLDERPRRIRISELYSKEANAIRDVIELREKWIADMIRELDEMRSEVRASPEPVTCSVLATELNALALANAHASGRMMLVGIHVAPAEGEESERMRRVALTVRSVTGESYR